MSEEDMEKAAEKIQNMCAITGYTAQEVLTAFILLAPAMNEAWKYALNNDALWSERAKQYGWLRTWWVRRRLREKYLV
jgi:hypothetical protein